MANGNRVSKGTEKRILSGLNNGGTLREVASYVGVHHKTVQNVGDRNHVVSVRSPIFPALNNTKTSHKIAAKVAKKV